MMRILILIVFIISITFIHICFILVTFDILFVSGVKFDKEVVIKAKTIWDNIILNDLDKLAISNSASMTVEQSRKSL